MWQNALDDVRLEKKSRADLINEKPTEEHIKFFKKTVDNVLQFSLPREYISFLSVVNGLECNGVIIYAIDDILTNITQMQYVEGFVQANERLHKNTKLANLIFFGEDNDKYWFLSDYSSFKLVDKKTLQDVYFFDCFSDMLEQMLRSMLGDYKLMQ